MSNLYIYNSKTKQKEQFKPINAPHVGMYVCGPTVYNEVHLGNVRTFISFDIVYRWLSFLGYTVRYVRNITDVGHLTDEQEEDKIAKQAKLLQLEPMEVAQRYTNDFHNVLRLFNCIEPSIEPHASGHIIEQIQMIEQIIEHGFGYEVNGSVYFDIEAYNKTGDYGNLSGRKLEDLLNNTRELDGQTDKKNPLDFAIWKKASAEHIMRWRSPWGDGFPGWHLECSAMSIKYLGEQFDIHGGGMDLKFPHHECEIAQNVGATGNQGANYWLHTNMLTVNGTKMSKSLGNGFTPRELMEGSHHLLDKPYSSMVVRFFMLQTHYSSTLDFSNEALQAAEKGYQRLMKSLQHVGQLTYSPATVNLAIDEEINQSINRFVEDMNDDFNTAKAMASLFELSNRINAFANHQLPIGSITKDTLTRLQSTFPLYIKDVLGLHDNQQKEEGKLEDVMQVFISLREKARANKDYALSDQIRDELSSLGIRLLDGADGTSWEKM